MGHYYGHDWLVKKKEEAEDIYSGLTDTTGDIVESGAEFVADAKDAYQTEVKDPVMKEVENAQAWTHTIQGDITDAAEWTKLKTAEGYVEQTEFLFGEEGWFADVTDPVEQAWAATQNQNYFEASIYTGEAFLNAVDVVGTGGLGKQAYDWIMGTKNTADDTGPLYWEVINENHIMVAYEGQEQFFKFDNPEGMAQFINKLESESIGSTTPTWTDEAGDPDTEDWSEYTDTDTQGTYGDPTPDTAGIDAKISEEYKSDPDLVKGGKGR